MGKFSNSEVVAPDGEEEEVFT